MDCRCVLPVAAGLAEGPCWWVEKQVLLWVDIEASRIGLFDPQTDRNDFLQLPAHVGAVVPTSVGDLLLATAAIHQYKTGLSMRFLPKITRSTTPFFLV